MSLSDRPFFLFRREGIFALIVTLLLTGVTLEVMAEKETQEDKKEQREEKQGKKKDKDKEDKKEKEARKKKEKEERKRRKEEEKKKRADDFSQIVPIPVGHGAEGIKVPQHDETGQLQMTFEIGSAFREDEVNLRMENLKIETFDEAGNLDMVIAVPKSIMDMKTRILTSKDPVEIERTDFKITGGNVTFNTRTRFGTFKGPVRMLIYNLETF